MSDFNFRKYLIVNKLTGEVEQTIQFGVDTDFPAGFILNDTDAVITMEDTDNIEITDLYDFKTGQFYIPDITDNQLEINALTNQLAGYEEVLSDFQEATWTAMQLDESKLPKEWRDKLNFKKDLRAQLAVLQPQ